MISLFAPRALFPDLFLGTTITGARSAPNVSYTQTCMTGTPYGMTRSIMSSHYRSSVTRQEAMYVPLSIRCAWRTLNLICSESRSGCGSPDGDRRIMKTCAVGRTTMITHSSFTLISFHPKPQRTAMSQETAQTAPTIPA